MDPETISYSNDICNYRPLRVSWDWDSRILGLSHAEAWPQNRRFGKGSWETQKWANHWQKFCPDWQTANRGRDT